METTPEQHKTPHELIAMGQCVSPYTVDRCPYCVDICEASHWKNTVNETLEGLKIDIKG